MDRPVAEQHAPVPSPQPFRRGSQRGMSRRTVMLGLAGVGGLAVAGVAVSAKPLYRFVEHLFFPPGLVFASGSFGDVMEAAWAPDGRRIAFGGSSSYGQQSTAGVIQIWDVFAEQQLVTLPIPTTSYLLFDLLLTWSPDGKYLLSASDGFAPASDRVQVVHTWDTTTGKMVRARTIPAGTWALNAQYLAVASGAFANAYAVRIQDVRDGRQVQIIPGPFANGEVYALLLRWAPDGRRLAIVNGDVAGGAGGVQIWDVVLGKQLLSAQFTGGVSGDAGVYPDDHYVAWSPDGRYLAAIIEHQKVEILDTMENQVVFTHQGNGDHLEAVAWSPGSPDRLAFSSVVTKDLKNQATIWLVDAFTNKHLQTYTEPDDVSRLIWSPDGKYLAVAGGDRVRIWQGA